MSTKRAAGPRRWASERYTCKSADTDRKSGAVGTDVGKGINAKGRLNLDLVSLKEFLEERAV